MQTTREPAKVKLVDKVRSSQTTSDVGDPFTPKNYVVAADSVHVAKPKPTLKKIQTSTK